MRVVVAFLIVLGLTSCTQTPRWKLPNAPIITFKPICADYRAAKLPENARRDGVSPAYLFDVGRATPDDMILLKRGLFDNGFAISGGTVTINGTKILSAFGEGVLRTQAMADRLYPVICALERGSIRLVHARYNQASETNRMI